MINKYPIGVMKTDVWRYAILYKYGGLFLDLDIRPVLSVRDWPGYPFDNI